MMPAKRGLAEGGAEETTLKEMKDWQVAAGTAMAEMLAAKKSLEALSVGTRANIDGVRVCLSTDGDVFLALEDDPELEAFRLTERQFLGLMGWGRKHVGEGPDGKSKDEP